MKPSLTRNFRPYFLIQSWSSWPYRYAGFEKSGDPRTETLNLIIGRLLVKARRFRFRLNPTKVWGKFNDVMVWNALSKFYDVMVLKCLIINEMMCLSFPPSVSVFQLDISAQNNKIHPQLLLENINILQINMRNHKMYIPINMWYLITRHNTWD